MNRTLSSRTNKNKKQKQSQNKVIVPYQYSQEINSFEEDANSNKLLKQQNTKFRQSAKKLSLSSKQRKSLISKFSKEDDINEDNHEVFSCRKLFQLEKMISKQESLKIQKKYLQLQLSHKSKKQPSRTSFKEFQDQESQNLVTDKRDSEKKIKQSLLINSGSQQGRISFKLIPNKKQQNFSKLVNILEERLDEHQRVVSLSDSEEEEEGMKRGATNFYQEDENDSSQSENFKKMIDERSRSDDSDNCSDWGMIKKYQATEVEVNYNIDLQILKGESLVDHLQKYYFDKHSFLQKRKQIVRFCFYVSHYCDIIEKNVLYSFLMIIIRIIHIILFIDSIIQQNSPNLEFMNFLFYFYLLELIISFFSKGTYYFLISNWFDLLQAIMYGLHLQTGATDFTPLRILKILNFLGFIFRRMQILLDSFYDSLRFLTEAFGLVLLFTIFFGLVGLHLFRGLYKYRCMEAISGIVFDDVCGAYQSCFNEYICVKLLDNQEISDSYDDFFYSFANSLRTMAMDRWSDVMYQMMLTFNPACVIYFILGIFTGGFFSLNMIIAVLKMHYAVQQERFDQGIIKNVNIDQPAKISLVQFKINGYYGLIPLLKNKNSILPYVTRETIQDQQQSDNTPLQRISISYNFNQLTTDGLKKNKKPRQLASQKIISINKPNPILCCFMDLQSSLLSDKIFVNKKILSKLLNDEHASEDMLEFSKVIENINLYELGLQVNYDNYIIQNKVLKNWEEKKQESEMIKLTKLFKTSKPIMIMSVSDQYIAKSRANISDSTTELKKKLPVRIKKQQSFNGQIRSVFIRSPRIKATRKTRLKTLIQLKSCKELNENLIMINGEMMNFRQIKKLIDRKIINNYKRDFDYSKKYQDLRALEIKQNLISKYNFSGEDVLIQPQKLICIIRAINCSEINIYLTGLVGILKNLKKHIRKYQLQLYLVYNMLVSLNTVILLLNGIMDDDQLIKWNEFLTVLLFITITILVLIRKKGLCKEDFFDQAILYMVFISDMLQYQNQSNINNSKYIKLISSLKSILFYRIIIHFEFATKIFHIVQKSYYSYIMLTFLFFLMIFVYSSLGMELYAHKFDQHSELGQLHSYEDPFKSFMTQLVILTNDDWWGVFTLGLKVNKPFTFLFIITMVYILNFMTFGFVFAVLLDGFSKLDTRDENENESSKKQIEQQCSQMFNLTSQDSAHEIEEAEQRKQTFKQLVVMKQEEKKNIQSQQELIHQQSIHDQTIGDYLLKPTFNNELLPDFHLGEIGACYIQNIIYFYQRRVEEIETEEFYVKTVNIRDQIDQIVEQQLKRFIWFENVDCKLSLYIFSQRNIFRKKLYLLSQFPPYVLFVNLTNIISILFFSFSTYSKSPNQSFQIFTSSFSTFTNFIILFDVFIQIIVHGLFIGNNTFVENIPNIIDSIYIFSYFIKTFFNVNGYYIDISAKFIYFRTTKLCYMFPQLNNIMKALILSLKDVIKILIAMQLIAIIFSNIGIILYKDTFHYCGEIMNFEVSQQQCLHENKEWMNYRQNFDNVTQSFTNLFIITTLDQWGEILQISQNTNTPQSGPKAYNNILATYLYFGSFIMIGSFFFLGLFAGVLYANFKNHKKKLNNEDLSADQLAFIQATVLLMKEDAQYSDPPYHIIRKLSFKLINTFKYQVMIKLVDFFNMIILCFIYDEMSLSQFQQVNIIYQILSLFVIFDSITKMLALGVVRYLGSAWRKIEFVISIISFIDIMLDISLNWSTYYYSLDISSPYFVYARIFFILRDSKLVLIIQIFSGIQRLLRVLTFAMQFLFQILAIFIIVLSFYANLGCNLFGHIDKGLAIDSIMNFHNYPQAMLTLFKCVCTYGWRQIMTDTMYYNPYCTPENDQYCGSMFISYAYFISFMIICKMVILNLFVLALVEQFEGFFDSQDNALETYVDCIDRFRTIWCKYSYDTKGQKMNTKFLSSFLIEIGLPLGADKGANLFDAAKIASKYKFKADTNNYINFKEVLYQVLRVAFKTFVFQDGTVEGIIQMKELNRQLTFRLQNQRFGNKYHREQIQNFVEVRTNFNILSDILFYLIVFKTWQSYSIKCNTRDEQNEFTDEIEDSTDQLEKEPQVFKTLHQTSEGEEIQQMNGIVQYANLMHMHQNAKLSSKRSLDQKAKKYLVPVAMNNGIRGLRGKLKQISYSENQDPEGISSSD